MSLDNPSKYDVSIQKGKTGLVSLYKTPLIQELHFSFYTSIIVLNKLTLD